MKIIISIWAVTLLVHLFEWQLNIPREVGVLLPLFYLGLSFSVFDKFNIVYRIFHHISVTGLALYYLLGLLINFKDIYFGSSVSAILSYSWFSSISFAYLFFCLLFLICYLPYSVYKKVNSKKVQ